jgi:hypothetical protein
MSGQLEPGCLAVVIKSVEGASVGKIVQCVKIQGEHSLYGTIWRVRSQSTIVTEYGGVGNEADCPAKWLKKIEPGSDLLNKKVITKKDDELVD